MSAEHPYIHATSKHRSCSNCVNRFVDSNGDERCKVFVSAFDGRMHPAMREARRRNDLCGAQGVHFIAQVVAKLKEAQQDVHLDISYGVLRGEL